MDSAYFEDAFKKLNLASATSVRYWDNRESYSDDAYLNEQDFGRKLPEIASLVRDFTSKSKNAVHSSGHVGPAPFILITAQGEADPGVGHDVLDVSATMLRELATIGAVPLQLITMYCLQQAHASYHVQYKDRDTVPNALYILLRVPRNSVAIHCSLRIRLSDGACVCFINSRSPDVLQSLRARAIRQMELLRTCPLHILLFIIEAKLKEYQTWHWNLWHSVGKLEGKTGMTPWTEKRASRAADLMDPNDFPKFLQELHSANVELNHEETIMRFAEDLLSFCRDLVGVLENLSSLAGARDVLKPGQRACFEGQLRYNENVFKCMRDKSTELLNRTSAQINVTYSLIAQKDSEQNTRIATLTANDSRTMKTITVLTLTFLPCTMLASLWGAGIFKLESDRSWRIYLGAACALTVIVFTVWYLYVWISTRKPSKTASEIKVEKVV